MFGDGIIQVGDPVKIMQDLKDTSYLLMLQRLRDGTLDVVVQHNACGCGDAISKPAMPLVVTKK